MVGSDLDRVSKVLTLELKDSLYLHILEFLFLLHKDPANVLKGELSDNTTLTFLGMRLMHPLTPTE